MENQTLVRYALDLPEALLNEIRLLSAHRKVEKHQNRTQRAIIIELIEAGLHLNTSKYESSKS
jgi:hypothetical protein